MLTTDEFAYLAGIIDGEGYFPDKNRKGDSEIVISTTNRKLALFLRQRLGGRLRRNKAGRKKDIYRWFWRRTEFQKELQNFYPYLIIKKNRADTWLTEPMSYLSNSVNSQKDNAEPSSLKLSYLAGIIDGEGCITLKVCRFKDGRMCVHPLIIIVNTSRELFRFITETLNGKVYWKENKGSFKANSLIGEYYIYSRKIKEILPEIEKYCIVKKPHLKVLRKFLNLKFNNELRDKNTGRFKPIEEEYLLKLLKLSRTMSILNQKKSILIGKV
jgi:hypothetical protein